MYVEAEWDLFKINLMSQLKPLVEESKGNPFAMLIHDAVTLANKSKYYSIGIQFIDNCFECNHVVALSFGKVSTTGSEYIADLAREVIEETTGVGFHTSTGSSVQDCAALSVAEELDLEPEKCTMHQGDKTGKSAIGELVRSKNKVTVNHFPHGLNLLKKLRDQAHHFSVVHTNRVKYDKFLEENPNLPGSSIQVDLNDTRMSSVHGLIRSSLRIKRTLTRYFATYDIPVYLNNEDWEFAREVEGVLNISKDLVTLSQNEKKINSVYGPLFKRTTHQGYLAEAIQLIDIESWGKTTRAPRSPKNVNAFSIRGRECRKRAMLECERRFFGNTEETTFE